MSSESESKTATIFLGVCLVLSLIYIVVQSMNCYYYYKAQDVDPDGQSVNLWNSLPIIGIIWAVLCLLFIAFLFLRSLT